jgi:acetyl esterase/lipase
MRAAIALAGVLVAAAPAAAAPLEAYGRLPAIEDPVLSPDGQRFAYATDLDGKRVIIMRSLTDGKALAGLRVGDQKLRDLTWGDDDHLLSTFSITNRARGITGPRREYFLTQSYSLTTSTSTALRSDAPNSLNVVFGVPQIRTVGGRALAFLTGMTFVNRIGVPALFAVDVANGTSSLVILGSSATQDWLIDEHGQVAAETRYEEDKQIWSLGIHHGDEWHGVYSITAPIETPEVEGFGPDGASLIVLAPDKGLVHYGSVKLSDDSWVAPPDLGNGFTDLVEDPANHRVIGTKQLGTGVDYRFFDSTDQAAWNTIATTFPHENVELASWSSDRRRLIVKVDGARDGSIYRLIDLNAHSSSLLGPVYRDVGPTDIAEVKPIVYKAADGTQIPAFLTLPVGRDPKNLPLVVLPHGGPAARDMPGFDWWSQALAAQGYVVLQPQFRGSDGFGWDQLAAGFGQWGRKMQTDLSDGVRFLASQGTIDPKRVCIVGASYGGYAALAGATLDRGIYRCAVSVAGVSDPRGFLRWRADQDDMPEDRTLRFWDRFMGVANSDDPKLAEISPLAHAGDADAPILLIHGEDDTVVPIDQSNDMERALRRAGKSVAYVRLDGEDHWLSKAETRTRMLTETVAFLKANNPPD